MYPGGSYSLEISKNKWVDATDPRYSDWTRYINDPYTPGKRTISKANVVFTATGLIKTKRHIKLDDELFIKYTNDDSYFTQKEDPHVPYNRAIEGPLEIV